MLQELLDYIDAKIEYEFASRELRADGYTDKPIEEAKRLEQMKENLINAYIKNLTDDLF